MTPDFRSIAPNLSWPETLTIRASAIHLTELGSRAVYELLNEIAADMGPAARRCLIDRLERFSALDRPTLERMGGVDLPPLAPLRIVAP